MNNLLDVLLILGANRLEIMHAVQSMEKRLLAYLQY